MDAPPLLPPGRYRVFGIPPETGLLLDRWIEVSRSNSAGCYGPADIPVATVIANLYRIEDRDGRVVWSSSSSTRPPPG